MSVSGCDFAALLERHGFDFFAGVPCSLIEDLIATLEAHPRLPYVAAVREDGAVGVAAGAWFGGRTPAVLMQNSGLGTSLNALASLSLLYGLPMLLVVTWRGYRGQDAPEHGLMGEITPTVLDLLGIPYRVLNAGSISEDLAWAADEMKTRMQPVAVIVPPGLMEIGNVPAPPLDGAPPEVAASPSSSPALSSPRISRRAALAAALPSIGAAPLIHANGYICRESFSLGDRPQNFYMIGSMGLAPAIGLGLALARPAETTVVFDGDGNLLMNLGVLPLVGALRPRNLLHCVFDNQAYGSTGNQRSISREVRLDRLAAAAGYRTSVAVTEAADLAAAVQTAVTTDGPHFVLAKVTREEAEVPRIPHSPHAIRDRFRASLGAEARAR